MADIYSAVIRPFPTAAARRDVARRAKEPPPQSEPPVSNARIAVVMLLVAETMFFSGLIGAYLVFRVGAEQWPPPNLPRLPIAVTWVNTVLLVISGFTMVGAVRAARRDDQPALRRGLLITATLGILFLVIQGSEWVRLVRHGLTLSTGMYGATFYTLIGTHAVHVLGAVAWLTLVGWWARRGAFAGGRDAAVEACAIFWVFVCVLWIALFALVYQ